MRRFWPARTLLVRSLDYLANIIYIDNDSYSQCDGNRAPFFSTTRSRRALRWNCYPSQTTGQRHAIPQLLRTSPDEIGKHD